MTLGNGGLAVIGRVAWHGMDKPGSMIIASHELTPDGLWLDDDGLLSWDLTTTDGAWASPHFRWREFRCACGDAGCVGKRAVPRLGLVRALETARWLCGEGRAGTAEAQRGTAGRGDGYGRDESRPYEEFPLHVSDGARCPAYNAELVRTRGASPTSAHKVQKVHWKAQAVQEWGKRLPEALRWLDVEPKPDEVGAWWYWMFDGVDVRPLEPMLSHGTLSRVYGALEVCGVAGLGLYWEPPAESAARLTRGKRPVAPRTVARGHVHADVKGRGGRRARWIRLPGMRKPYYAQG